MQEDCGPMYKSAAISNETRRTIKALLKQPESNSSNSSTSTDSEVPTFTQYNTVDMPPEDLMQRALWHCFGGPIHVRQLTPRNPKKYTDKSSLLQGELSIKVPLLRSHSLRNLY